MTVFTALDKYHEDAHSPIRIKDLLTNGETIGINNELEKFNCLGENGAKPSRYSYGDKYIIDSIVAPAKQLLDEEWINGYKGAFSTLTKKRSYDELQNGKASHYNVPNLIKHIEDWK